MRFIAPSESALTRTIEMIAGESTSCAASDATPTNIAFSGVFVDDDGAVVASCDCDLPTAAALGCALSMIPPGGAEGMVEDGELTANASGNLYECMNMFSSLLMSESTDHLKLERVDATPPDIAGDVREKAYTMDLGRYGGGALLFRYL